MPSSIRNEIVGLFVGGKSLRMGQPKGLLPSRVTGEPIVVRLARMAEELGFEPVLVGDASPYTRVLSTLRVVADQPPDIGPLGGLSGVLAMAGQRGVIALACDMPYVSSELLSRVADSAQGAMVLAPRGQAGYWEPLCARYDPAQVRPLLSMALARGVRSFRQLFDSLDVTELKLSEREREELLDWDRPEDIPEGKRR